MTGLRTSRSAVADACVLTAYGLLDDSTYLPLRDAIVKAALDEPVSVVVDITALSVRNDAALAVFTSARWQVSEWPDIPIGLVCAHDYRLNALRHNAITRYVPVFPTVQLAVTDLAADALRRYRRRVRVELPPLTSSSARSRQLTAQWLTAWSRTDFITAVSVIGTELVEIALTKSDGPVALRLETDGSTMAVAVQFTRSASVVRREAVDGVVSELDLIAASCRVWGSHSGADGDIVWAVLGPENRF